MTKKTIYTPLLSRARFRYAHDASGVSFTGLLAGKVKGALLLLHSCNPPTENGESPQPSPQLLSGHRALKSFSYLCNRNINTRAVKKYIDVVLPLPLANRYTYSLPSECSESVKTGCRVVVPFGRKKIYTAIVINVHCSAPEAYETKDIIEVLDAGPIILPSQLKLWEWIASYYLCTLGDVYKAALPSGLKLESETRIVCNPEFAAAQALPEKEQTILGLLSKDSEQSITLLEKYSGMKNILPVIKSLLDKEAIFVKEELKRSYKPKTETRIRLTAGAACEERMEELFNKLSHAPKQLAVLMKYVELSGLFSHLPSLKDVSKKDLLDKSGASVSTLNGLLAKDILEIYYHETGRLDKKQENVEGLNRLNPAQQQAYDSVNESFKDKNVCLLHGVTSGGKTEIYIHLMQKAICSGKQVLYLLPEIALTTQITKRLKRVFGNRLGIYHSKFPDAERVEIWRKQLGEQDYDIILGVRSSVFLPFRNLGLVIVDEEHENTYKQYDPAPRYHARSAAIMLASMSGAKTLLGTATPSVESYYNAEAGKYGLVELKERYKDIQLPQIQAVDIQELIRKKRMNGHFSPALAGEVKKALQRKEQIILFQNRRGFAPMIECHTCAWVPKCKNCDVSLTYHKGIGQLTCHYCGYTIPVPASCPACGEADLRNRGFGTEKIEDDIKQLFPEASVARMDLDTTRTRTAYEKIIAGFEQGKIDILIGTQMVSKGLDFDRVSVVGILNADTMLNYPDFRSYERAFQLMAQVAGRAGRKNRQGLVVLQTKSINHDIIHRVMQNDYKGMYASQLTERRLFRYPPYFRLIYVYLKNKHEDLLGIMARTMADKLRAVFGDRVLGPGSPPVARIQALYIKKIIIKIEIGASTEKVREQLLRVQHEIIEDKRFHLPAVYYDVDPM